MFSFLWMTPLLTAPRETAEARLTSATLSSSLRKAQTLRFHSIRQELVLPRAEEGAFLWEWIGFHPGTVASAALSITSAVN